MIIVPNNPQNALHSAQVQSALIISDAGKPTCASVAASAASGADACVAGPLGSVLGAVLAAAVVLTVAVIFVTCKPGRML